jgi:hypothetical protein
MRSQFQVQTVSCRNAGKCCVHKTQSGRILPRILRKKSYVHRAVLLTDLEQFNLPCTLLNQILINEIVWDNGTVSIHR